MASGPLVIIDYGRGNLRSVEKACSACGAGPLIASSPAEIERAARVLLPGVGAFADCMAQLEQRRLLDAVRRAAREKPFLGICLGLQLLFDESEEFGPAPGLGLLPGRVVKIPAASGGRQRKVPHVGFNSVEWRKPHALTAGIPAGTPFYFVHSYVAAPAEPGDVLGACEYEGEWLTAAVARDNLAAVQFHPEKSSRAGLTLLRNFTNWSP